MPKLVTILVAVFVVGCLLTNVDAQYAFVIPNPDLADFDPRNDVEQYSVHNFEWSLDLNNQRDLSLDGGDIMASDGMVSLWVVSFDLSWSQILNPYCNSSHGGSWAWEVNLSDDLLASCGYQFAYHILPPVTDSSTKFTETLKQAPSRGFRIFRKSDGDAETAAIEPTPTVAAGGGGEPTSATPTTTDPQPTSTSSDSGSASGGDGGGMSTEAKIGIGVGVPSVAIAAITLWVMILRHR